MKFRLLSFALLTTALLLVHSVSHPASVEAFRSRIQTLSLPYSLIERGRLSQLLNRLNLAHLIPNSLSRNGAASLNPEYLNAVRSGQRRRWREHYYPVAVGQPDPETLPSSTRIDSGEKTGAPAVLSLAVDSEDLNDPKIGIVANWKERGRNWEVPASLTLFRRGELVFASGIGLRLHGGTTRNEDRRSWRVVFRERYGIARLPTGLLFNGSSAGLDALVLHNDRRPGPLLPFSGMSRKQLRATLGGDLPKWQKQLQARPSRSHWYFTNPLSYDLVRGCGGIAPNTEPVRMYINGEDRSVYFLTEYLNNEFAERVLGTKNLLWVDTKPSGNPKHVPEYQKLLDWIDKSPAPLDLREVEKRIDVENLSRWILLTAFTGTVDAFQGMALRAVRPGGDERWRWVHWDMDHGFRMTRTARKKYLNRYGANFLPRENWEIPTFEQFFDSNDLRARVFARLIRESAAYRDYFLSFSKSQLDGCISPPAVMRVIEKYRQIAKEFQLEDQKFFLPLEYFLARRTAFVRKALDGL